MRMEAAFPSIDPGRLTLAARIRVEPGKFGPTCWTLSLTYGRSASPKVSNAQDSARVRRSGPTWEPDRTRRAGRASRGAVAALRHHRDHLLRHADGTGRVLAGDQPPVHHHTRFEVGGADVRRPSLLQPGLQEERHHVG